jgi:hypothetical protein
MQLMNLQTENKDPNKTLVSKKHLSSPRLSVGTRSSACKTFSLSFTSSARWSASGATAHRIVGSVKLPFSKLCRTHQTEAHKPTSMHMTYYWEIFHQALDLKPNKPISYVSEEYHKH